MGLFRRRLAVAVAAATLAVACVKAPYTNRLQLDLVPEKTMNQLGQQSYAQLLQQSSVQRGTPDARRLAEVGKHIAAVADKPDYAWETALIQDPQINAFCLPGGYIAFYDAILPVLQNEASMAFVMGHETGHAVAHHGAERLSQQLGLQGALSIVDMLLQSRSGLSKKDEKLVMGAIGLGAQYGVVLPFSRTQEKEADIIGLMLMAQAGYPPATTTGVWQRMQAATGKGPPAFLSDHPSYDQREAVVKQYLPEARRYYQRSAKRGSAVTTPVW